MASLEAERDYWESLCTARGIEFSASDSMCDIIDKVHNRAWYYRTPPINVTGDRSDGVAGTNLLVALERLGIITDSTTA